MDDKELREKGPPEDFDNTILSNWTGCHRDLYWFLRGLDYKETPGYFVFGRAFGSSCNIWHSSEGDRVKDRLEAALATGKKIWEKECPAEHETNNWETFEEVFKEYVVNYGEKEPWTMLYGKGEKGFALPLPGAPQGVKYCGAIDAPILWKPYGMLSREDKTTGDWVNQKFLDQWDYATQPTGYIWAFETVIGECFGCYMNIAGKKRRKEPSDRFARYLTKRTEGELERFMEESVRLVEEIWREWDCGQWNWDKTGKRNQMICVGGMGRSRCLYASLCALDLEPWELEEYSFLDEFTWRGKWAPWERDGEDS